MLACRKPRWSRPVGRCRGLYAASVQANFFLFFESFFSFKLGSDCRLENKFKYLSYLRLLPVSLAFCDLNDTFFIKIRSAEVNLQAHEVSSLGKYF